MIYQYKMQDFVKDGEKIMVHRSVWMEGYLPEHGHLDFMEVFYVESGNANHVLNGEKCGVKAGDLMFLSFVSRHTFESVTDDFRWIDITFVPEFISSFMLNKYNAEDILKLSIFSNFRNYNISNSQDIILRNVKDEFENLILEMLNEYDGKGQGYIQNMRYYLLALLAKIFRNTSVNAKDNGEIKSDDLINFVMEELNRSDHWDLNLEEIAKKACMSYKYFSRIFRQRSGIRFTDFIIRKRIEKTCELLTESDMQLSEIMRCVGFNDPKSFYYNFKKLIGVTPNQYKQQLKP